jgi:hypothetical protein
MAQMIDDNILQDFSRNPDGRLCLHFSDPAYVSSELIIFDRKDSSIHAILHGTSHFVGLAGRDLAGSLKHNDAIILMAPHHYSGTLHLPSKISVV